MTLLATSAGCGVFNWLRPEHQSGAPTDALTMPATYVQAASVALNDFLERERRNNAATATDAGVEIPVDAGTPAGAGVITVTTVAACFERPEAYEARVRFDSEHFLYHVDILPVPEVCMGDAGWALVGGGAHYQISATTFEILESSLIE